MDTAKRSTVSPISISKITYLPAAIFSFVMILTPPPLISIVTEVFSLENISAGTL